MWMAGAQAARPPSPVFPGAQARLAVKQPGLQLAPIWDACIMPVPAPSYPLVTRTWDQIWTFRNLNKLLFDYLPYLHVHLLLHFQI